MKTINWKIQWEIYYGKSSPLHLPHHSSTPILSSPTHSNHFYSFALLLHCVKPTACIPYVNWSLVFTSVKHFVFTFHILQFCIRPIQAATAFGSVSLRWEKEVNKWKAMHLNNQLNKLKFLEELNHCFSMKPPHTHTHTCTIESMCSLSGRILNVL